MAREGEILPEWALAIRIDVCCDEGGSMKHLLSVDAYPIERQAVPCLEHKDKPVLLPRPLLLKDHLLEV